MPHPITIPNEKKYFSLSSPSKIRARQDSEFVWNYICGELVPPWQAPKQLIDRQIYFSFILLWDILSDVSRICDSSGLEGIVQQAGWRGEAGENFCNQTSFHCKHIFCEEHFLSIVQMHFWLLTILIVPSRMGLFMTFLVCLPIFYGAGRYLCQ